jgi:hypothetical protein
MFYSWYSSFEIFVGLWGIYFGHVMSKTCQYGSNDERMVTSLKHVNVKNA